MKNYSKKYYPVRDHIPGVYGQRHLDYMGKITGEFREPKAGEWYLSGAIPECYRMSHDSGMKFHIIKLCQIKRIETIIEVENG